MHPLQSKPPAQAQFETPSSPPFERSPKLLKSSRYCVHNQTRRFRGPHIEPVRVECRRFWEEGLAAHDGGVVEGDVVACGDGVSVDADVTCGHLEVVCYHGANAQGLVDDLTIPARVLVVSGGSNVRFQDESRALHFRHTIGRGVQRWMQGQDTSRCRRSFIKVGRNHAVFLRILSKTGVDFKDRSSAIMPFKSLHMSATNHTPNGRPQSELRQT